MVDFIGRPMPRVARGYAIAIEGKILVETVSPHARAATVNWLVTGGGQVILKHHTDADIKRMWFDLKPDTAEIVEVEIRVKR